MTYKTKISGYGIKRFQNLPTNLKKKKISQTDHLNSQKDFFLYNKKIIKNSLKTLKQLFKTIWNQKIPISGYFNQIQTYLNLFFSLQTTKIPLLLVMVTWVILIYVC